MDVVSYGPLLVSQLLWQPRPGAHALTVICKATFNLEPVTSPLAAVQRPPWTNELQWDRHYEQMMEVAGDYAPFKRRADILVTGRAIPPPNNRLSTITASIAVGGFSKTIDVHVQQHWTVAALGPLAPTWPVRTALLGRHASTWNHANWNMHPLPDDIDGAFFNAASIDQQVAELTGQEAIVLENLHPRHPKLWTQLVRVVPQATVTRANGASQEMRLRCDTLTIDADDGLAMLTWRGVVLLEYPAEPGVIAVRAYVATSDSQIPAPTTAPDADYPATMAFPSVGATTTSLPFIPGPPQTPDIPEPVKTKSSWPPTRTTTSSDRPQTMALNIADAPAELKAVMPFQSDTPETRQMPTERLEIPDPEPPAIVAHMPFDVPPPPMVSSPPAAVHADVIVEKPPMIGPIPTLEPAVDKKPEVAQAKPIPTAPHKPISESPRSELTIEQHATIAAELAEGKTSRADVLRAHEISADDWTHDDRRWKDAIAKDEQRGKRALRDAHDAAYVARVEQFRGEISLEEVARILVGLERRNAREVLDELRIQRAALMPIVRLWTKRIATNMRLNDKAAELVREARRA
ncbi:MAG: DUF2169 domain-containing protein [Polyangiaceae bacterium]|nr:DUF2169 domain-containing protein [Polyangiaceae bacterium]